VFKKSATKFVMMQISSSNKKKQLSSLNRVTDTNEIHMGTLW